MNKLHIKAGINFYYIYIYIYIYNEVRDSRNALTLVRQFSRCVIRSGGLILKMLEMVHRPVFVNFVHHVY